MFSQGIPKYRLVTIRSHRPQLSLHVDVWNLELERYLPFFPPSPFCRFTWGFVKFTIPIVFRLGSPSMSQNLWPAWGGIYRNSFGLSWCLTSSVKGGMVTSAIQDFPDMWSFMLDIFDLPACDQMGVSYPIINLHIWKQTGCSFTMDYASLFRDYVSTYMYIYIYIHISYTYINIYIC